MEPANSADLARWLIVAGVVLMLAGGAVWLIGHVPFLGRLPGDLRLEGDGWRVSFPIVTCIVLSLLLTLALNLWLGRR